MLRDFFQRGSYLSYLTADRLATVLEDIAAHRGVTVRLHVSSEQFVFVKQRGITRLKSSTSDNSAGRHV